MSEGTWEKLSNVAVKGAQYDSRERQPHPKCLKGTRIVLLNHIYESLDNQGKSRLIGLHGTAGVGKSAVAFTVAERMRGLKVKEGSKEKRLAGTFFFSRKHTKRRTTGYFFATLVYQLASNFPSIRGDVNRTILDNPALLDHDTSLRDQMEALFLHPLRRLQLRLRECPPLTFVIDALDECASESFEDDTSESEFADLISLLGEALCEPDLPVTHILLTSRSEEYIRKAMQSEEMRPLVCEIPVKTSGEGVAATISLDGADVDNDIYVFLQHSFRELGTRHPDFPQPSNNELARLASRAGRRFIVASTMMKFTDDRHNDPRDQLQLMLELTSELLPGTEVYKLYDRILSTCTDPALAYLHLSVIAVLADPLPIGQISKLLGPGDGRDVESVLVQLRSVIDVPTDSNLPVNIYHSSIRDYVSHHSNSSLRQVHAITSPHTLLALSCLRLMAHDLLGSTALPDVLSELTKHSQAMESHEPQNLKHTLDFIVQPPEPLQVLIGLLWLRGHRNSELQFWLDTRDGRAWLQTDEVRDWIQTQDGKDWLATDGAKVWLWTRRGKHWLQGPGVRDWLQTQHGQGWLQTQHGRVWMARGRGRTKNLGGRDWLQTDYGQDWLQTQHGEHWLQTRGGKHWLKTQEGKHWLQAPNTEHQLLILDKPEHNSHLHPLNISGPLQTSDDTLDPPSPTSSTEAGWLQTTSWGGLPQTSGAQAWLQAPGGRHWLQWLETQVGRYWLLSRGGQDWLRTQGAKDWLQTPEGREWLRAQGGKDWLQTLCGREWLWTRGGKDWMQTPEGREWLQTQRGTDWLQTLDGREWLGTTRGREWLQTPGGKDWLQTLGGRDWLQTPEGREWLQTQGGREWLGTTRGREWLGTTRGREWLQTQGGKDWLQTLDVREWLQTQGGKDWMQTPEGREWLQTQGGKDWLQTPDVREWLQTQGGKDWIQIPEGREWLQTQGGKDWLQTPDVREWLQTQGGKDWLQTLGGREWLGTTLGREWLGTALGREWLGTTRGREWLQTPGGKDWLQTLGGRDWLQTPQGQTWRLTTLWVTVEEFLSTLETAREFIIVPDSPLQPAFQVIQQFKSLPDFLMFPAFLALRRQDHSAFTSTYNRPLPDVETIHAMSAFIDFASKAWERSRLTSDALKYACQNWALHLSRAPNSRDEPRLTCLLESFWTRNLLSWLERQWCLKDLRSCLTILCEGEKLAQEHLQAPRLSLSRV